MINMTSNSCFICSNLLIECHGKGDARVLKKKALETLESVSWTHQDLIHYLLKDLPPKSTVLVKNSCYKKYTNEQKWFGNEQVATTQLSAKSTWTKGSYDYRTHCLICEEELDFELASKCPDLTANQISTINWIDVATKKCKLHKTLKTFCEGKTDPLSLEVSSKIQYAKCLWAEEAKYHRDCMQCFLSGRSVRELKVNRRNFLEAKNTLFERFCEWYETTAHESSAVTLFDVQKWMEEFQGDSNEEVYTLKTINHKLKAKYGDSLRFTSWGSTIYYVAPWRGRSNHTWKFTGDGVKLL